MPTEWLVSNFSKCRFGNFNNFFLTAHQYQGKQKAFWKAHLKSSGIHFDKDNSLVLQRELSRLEDFIFFKTITRVLPIPILYSSYDEIIKYLQNNGFQSDLA
jgi:hypothetical protein